MKKSDGNSCIYEAEARALNSRLADRMSLGMRIVRLHRKQLRNKLHNVSQKVLDVNSHERAMPQLSYSHLRRCLHVLAQCFHLVNLGIFSDRPICVERLFVNASAAALAEVAVDTLADLVNIMIHSTTRTCRCRE